MRYFKNKELTGLYNVSDKTVRNWIEASRQKKLPLDLCENRGRLYICNNGHNQIVLHELVLEGRKYQNKRSFRAIAPSAEFYQLFTRRQIIEIVNEMDKYQLLPMKYKYFGEGATYWDQYLKELQNEGSGNLVTNTLEVLGLDLNYLESQTKIYKHVNVVNLCVGNSIAMKRILEHFKATGKLRRFVMLDISEDMHDISEKNVRDWFDGQVISEKYIRDLSYERFGDILAADSFGSDANETINLIFLVAGPIVNFYDPQHVLRTIQSSMGKNDLMVVTLKRDTPRTRKFFNFDIKDFSGGLNPHDALLLKLLNIDESFYAMKQTFNETKGIRGVQIVLNRDLSIHFEIDQFSKTIGLKKGYTIPIWWSWHHSDEGIIRRLTSAGFEVHRVTKSQDDQLIMLVARISTSKNHHLF